MRVDGAGDLVAAGLPACAGFGGAERAEVLDLNCFEWAFCDARTVALLVFLVVLLPDLFALPVLAGRLCARTGLVDLPD